MDGWMARQVTKQAMVSLCDLREVIFLGNSFHYLWCGSQVALMLCNSPIVHTELYGRVS